MAANTRRRTSKSLVIARILLGGMLLVSVVLICLASFLPKPADTAEIKAALDEAARDRAAREIALKEARKAVPKDAPIPPEWQYSKVLDALEGRTGHLLAQLASTYLENTDDISDDAMERLRDILKEKDPGLPDNPFYFPFDPDRQPKQEILASLSTFLPGLKELRDVESGLELGLCQGVVNDYTSPRYTNIVALCALFAGRAACEVQAGDQARALETCLTGYRIARLLGEWPHYQSYMERYFANRVVDRALFRVLDAGPVSEEAKTRILEALDSRKATDGLARTLRLYAAYLEAGLEGENRGYPSFSDYGFAFTGRGSMERAKRIGALLDKPPFAVRPELEEIAGHTPGGYWVNHLCDYGIQSCKMHAREALVADIARIAFALKAHEQKQGAYPASLQELNPLPLPETPKDPLTGAPVVYQGGGSTFIISAPPVKDIWGEMYWVARK